MGERPWTPGCSVWCWVSQVGKALSWGNQVWNAGQVCWILPDGLVAVTAHTFLVVANSDCYIYQRSLFLLELGDMTQHYPFIHSMQLHHQLELPYWTEESWPCKWDIGATVEGFSPQFLVPSSHPSKHTYQRCKVWYKNIPRDQAINQLETGGQVGNTHPDNICSPSLPLPLSLVFALWIYILPFWVTAHSHLLSGYFVENQS